MIDKHTSVYYSKSSKTEYVKFHPLTFLKETNTPSHKNTWVKTSIITIKTNIKIYFKS